MGSNQCVWSWDSHVIPASAQHKHFMVFEVWWTDPAIPGPNPVTPLDSSIFCFEDIRVGKLLHLGSFFQWLIILAAKNVSLISHMNLVDFCFPFCLLCWSHPVWAVEVGQMTKSISSSNSSNPAKFSGGLQFIFFREVMVKIFCSNWWEITLLTFKNWPPCSPISLPPTLFSNLFLQLIKRESPAGRRNWNRKIPCQEWALYG